HVLYSLYLHDALPISISAFSASVMCGLVPSACRMSVDWRTRLLRSITSTISRDCVWANSISAASRTAGFSKSAGNNLSRRFLARSEEHTSELQSPDHL